MVAVALKADTWTSSHAVFTHSRVNAQAYNVTLSVLVQIAKVTLGHGPRDLAFADRGEVEVIPTARHVFDGQWLRGANTLTGKDMRGRGQLPRADRGRGGAIGGWVFEHHHRWRRHVGRALSTARISFARMIWFKRHDAMILSTQVLS